MSQNPDDTILIHTISYVFPRNISRISPCSIPQPEPRIFFWLLLHLPLDQPAQPAQPAPFIVGSSALFEAHQQRFEVPLAFLQDHLRLGISWMIK